jgi:hypothetical protein
MVTVTFDMVDRWGFLISLLFVSKLSVPIHLTFVRSKSGLLNKHIEKHIVHSTKRRLV